MHVLAPTAQFQTTTKTQLVVATGEIPTEIEQALSAWHNGPFEILEDNLRLNLVF